MIGERWREYFRGTAAHNTVRTFEGWHDGYMRLEDPVKHRRLIQLHKNARRVVIEDTLEMQDEHDVELFFHCSERCAVEPLPDGYLLSAGGASLKLVLPQMENAIHGATRERRSDRRLDLPRIRPARASLHDHMAGPAVGAFPAAQRGDCFVE